MKLCSRFKWNGGGVHRTIPPEQTVRLIRPFMDYIGVTRVSDCTDLDKLGIPVFAAVRPGDANMGGISVYNGKGLTKVESLAGAMMEAVERFCGETWLNRTMRGTASSLSKVYPDVRLIDVGLLKLQQSAKYDGQELDWGLCWDLLSDSEVAAPLNWFLCPYEGPARGVWYSSTNGLASGNNIEEAVCHALAELIERDAYTLAMVRSQLRPRFTSLVQDLAEGREVRSHADPDRSAYPLVDVQTLPAAPKRLVRRIEKQGAQVWLRSLVSDTGIPVFIASVRDVGLNGEELVAGGFGCHPDAEVAAIRAITEAAQGRVVQIQGTREDATRAGNYGGGERVLWCNNEGRIISFNEVKSFKNVDILDDIQVMIESVRRIGASHILIANLSNANLPVSVVRVIVPEMESWFLTDFSPEGCLLGLRGQRELVGV